MQRLDDRLSLAGWLIYDLANTIFSMNILTMYFAQWIIVDLGYPDIYYSFAYSASMIVVALTLPILGNRSDERGSRKSYLVIFSLCCIGSTAVLGLSTLVTTDTAVLVIVGLASLALANYFFEGGLVFYNALLASVSTPKNVGAVSGFGTGLGYVGAILGLLMVQPIVENGFAFLGPGRQSAFLPTAILFLIFFIPTWVFLKDRRAQPQVSTRSKGRGEFRKLIDNLKEARKYKAAFRLLIANYFFVDAISTLIIFMAVYSEKVMGFPDDEKILLFIISTTSAVVGSFVAGRLSDALGHYRTLKWVVIGWFMLLVGASITVDKTIFWVLGSCVGILLGSTWTISRPLLNSFVPESKLGLFYGLYSLTGKAAAVIGPLIWGFVVLQFTSESLLGGLVVGIFESIGVTMDSSVAGTIEYRFAVLSLALLMAAGYFVYRKIPRVMPSGDKHGGAQD